jgi:hypothetical protein
MRNNFPKDQPAIPRDDSKWPSYMTDPRARRVPPHKSLEQLDNEVIEPYATSRQRKQQWK